MLTCQIRWQVNMTVQMSYTVDDVAIQWHMTKKNPKELENPNGTSILELTSIFIYIMNNSKSSCIILL